LHAKLHQTLNIARLGIDILAQFNCFEALWPMSRRADVIDPRSECIYSIDAKEIQYLKLRSVEKAEPHRLQILAIAYPALFGEIIIISLCHNFP